MKRCTCFFTKAVSGNLALSESNLFQKKVIDKNEAAWDKEFLNKIGKLRIINKAFSTETPRPSIFQF